MSDLSKISPAARDSAALRDVIGWHNMTADHGDPWGSIMGTWFDVADEIARRGEACPESWRYQCGALGAPDPDSELSAMLASLSMADLVVLGARLESAADEIKAAGRDY